MTKHRSIREFKADLASLDERKCKQLFVFGSCEYLSKITLQHYKQQCAYAGIDNVCSIEASSIDESQWISLLDQPSFFEPASLFVLRRCEQAKSIVKLMQVAQSTVSSSNRVCFFYGSDNVPTVVKALTTKSDSLSSVSCLEPWPNEIPTLVKEMATKLRLAMTVDAIDFLIASIGSDLSSLDNEISKLSLILAEETAPITAKTIAPHLGMLREDDAFTLANLLLAKQWAKAQALSGSLLQRGESALALVGIIANHCRNAARIAMGAQTSEIRLPPSVYQNYKRAYYRHDPVTFIKALEKCRQIDLLLKSSKISDEILVASLIDSLT